MQANRTERTAFLFVLILMFTAFAASTFSGEVTGYASSDEEAAWDYSEAVRVEDYIAVTWNSLGDETMDFIIAFGVIFASMSVAMSMLGTNFNNPNTKKSLSVFSAFLALGGAYYINVNNIPFAALVGQYALWIVVLLAASALGRLLIAMREGATGRAAFTIAVVGICFILIGISTVYIMPNRPAIWGTVLSIIGFLMTVGGGIAALTSGRETRITERISNRIFGSAEGAQDRMRASSEHRRIRRREKRNLQNIKGIVKCARELEKSVEAFGGYTPEKALKLVKKLSGLVSDESQNLRIEIKEEDIAVKAKLAEAQEAEDQNIKRLAQESAEIQHTLLARKRVELGQILYIEAEIDKIISLLKQKAERKVIAEYVKEINRRAIVLLKALNEEFTYDKKVDALERAEQNIVEQAEEKAEVEDKQEEQLNDTIRKKVRVLNLKAIKIGKLLEQVLSGVSAQKEDKNKNSEIYYAQLKEFDSKFQEVITYIRKSDSKLESSAVKVDEKVKIIQQILAYTTQYRNAFNKLLSGKLSFAVLSKPGKKAPSAYPYARKIAQEFGQMIQYENAIMQELKIEKAS